jgi:hypothetical protein
MASGLKTKATFWQTIDSTGRHQGKDGYIIDSKRENLNPFILKAFLTAG